MSEERIEDGDIFFFHRERLFLYADEERADVQRLFMVLAPRGPRPKLRVFVVGRKRVPRGEEAQPLERAWAVNVLTTREARAVRRALEGLEAMTRTREMRLTTTAIPIGAGLYEIVRHQEHTELGYVLAQPDEPGRVQEQLGLRSEASYVVAVKNPCLPAPGMPTGRSAGYPAKLLEKFGDRRWIAVDDACLLDHRNAQLVLIGANARGVEDELGLRVQRDTRFDAFDALHARRLEQGVRPLFAGVFPDATVEEVFDDVDVPLVLTKRPGGAPRGFGEVTG
ncbi:MAG: hypothetical protein Q8O67_08600 [Deltaproteobacteria bacterium]|nr:hypothetical protein [Deltaproteobacteria bacterium]